MESFTGYECIKKGISLSHMSTAQPSALQHVFDIMENRRITTDELQLASSLLCNNSCNYAQRFKDGDDYDDDDNNLLQLGCYPVAVVILRVYKT